MKPIYVLTLRIAAPLKSVSEVHNCKVSFFFLCGPYVLEVSSKFRIQVPRNKSQSHTTPLIGLQQSNLSSEPIFMFFLFCCCSILAKFDRRVLGGRNRFQVVFVPVSELLFASNQSYAAGMLMLMYMLPAHRRWKH